VTSKSEAGSDPAGRVAVDTSRDRSARSQIGRPPLAWPALPYLIVALTVTLVSAPGSPSADAAPKIAAETWLPGPGDSAWHPLRFRSIENQTTYEVVTHAQGRTAYQSTSRCGASAMLMELPEILDLERTPRLAWRWRIDRGILRDDERSKSGDDFAARVYVLFRFDSKRATRWQRIEHAIGARWFGVAPPGETLTYVWGSREPVGATWTSAIRQEARIVVLETSSDSTSNEWREAIVDLAADAKRLFDPPPRLQPYALGLMTDTDGACDEASARFADFRLLGPALPPSSPSAASEDESP
jgi:hypothetical protein